MTAKLLFENFEILADAPNGILKLRELILQLAVQGKLVPQDPKDEPASVLVANIRKVKDPLKWGKEVKRSDSSSPIKTEEFPYDLPNNWTWCRVEDIAQHNSGKTLDGGRNNGSLRDYITTSNLYWGTFDLYSLRQMPIGDNEIERCSARKGDLLICEGGDAGRAAVWDKEYSKIGRAHV